MSDKGKDKKPENKIKSFILTFLAVAVAITAFWIFFDWFNFTFVKKEAFEFQIVRHVAMPCVIALAYSLVMQFKVFGKDDKDK